MALYELRSFVARRPARIFDGLVLAIVTLAALFWCYEVEIFPTNSKPYTLELDELLFVSTIFCGGLFICALRRLAELQRGIGRAAMKPASATGRVSGHPFLLHEPKAKSKAASIDAGSTPVGRPSKNAEIETAIRALTSEGVDLSKLPRKDAYARIRHKAARLGANIEVGFSAPVIQRMLVRRYGPRA